MAVEADRWAVGGRQKAEGRKQKAVGSRQKAESRKQKAAGGRWDKNLSPQSRFFNEQRTTDKGPRTADHGPRTTDTDQDHLLFSAFCFLPSAFCVPCQLMLEFYFRLVRLAPGQHIYD